MSIEDVIKESGRAVFQNADKALGRAFDKPANAGRNTHTCFLIQANLLPALEFVSKVYWLN